MSTRLTTTYKCFKCGAIFPAVDAEEYIQHYNSKFDYFWYEKVEECPECSSRLIDEYDEETDTD